MENTDEQVNSNIPRKSLEIIPSQKLLMGVCTAFGNYIKVNPVIVRIIVLLLFILIGQAIILIYAAFGLLLPVKENTSSQNNDLLNKISISILFTLVLILLILIQLNQINLGKVYNFFSERIDAFSLLVFSIALLINGFNKQKEMIEMKETNYKKLTLSEKKVVFGVCGGLAEYLNIHPYLMRILWVIFAISSLGTAVLIYIILRFIIPPKNISSYDVE